MSDYAYSAAYKKGRASARKGESHSSGLARMRKTAAYKRQDEQGRNDMDEGFGEGYTHGAANRRNSRNSGMAKLKLNKWVSADRVRLVKRNGKKVIEVKRMQKVKRNSPKRRRVVRSNSRNGYVVYPAGTGHMKLSAANKKAKADSKREGHARVESVDTQRTMSRWVDGRRA
jgi:hypothetical protein